MFATLREIFIVHISLGILEPFYGLADSARVNTRRALVFPLAPHQCSSLTTAPRTAEPLANDPESGSLPLPVRGLMDDFRLLVNQCLRETLSTQCTSRAAISRFARRQALEARVNGQIGLAAVAIASSLAHGHQRRRRRGIPSRVPFVRAPFVTVPAKCFHFDLDSGRLRLSLRRGEWASFPIPVSDHHRQVLARREHRVTQVHIGLHRAVIVYAKAVPDPYVPTSLVALDTNESSLDGVRVDPTGATFVRAPFPEIRTVQARHTRRRRHLAPRKAHDRRLARKLLGREGRRERNRVRSRLHDLSHALIDQVAQSHAALVLEDLTGLPRARRRPGSRRRLAFRSRAFRHRLSSWPQSELHRQLAYKAADQGVPIFWLSPYRTSSTCPRCGEVSEHRRRVGTRFECAKCGWSLDRQLNAGLNLGLIALRRTAGLGGLRLDPDALPQDVVRPLYPLDNDRRARVERTGREGERSKARPNG